MCKNKEQLALFANIIELNKCIIFQGFTLTQALFTEILTIIIKSRPILQKFKINLLRMILNYLFKGNFTLSPNSVSNITLVA